MAAGASFSLVKDKVWGWIVKKPIAVENPDGDPWAPVPVSKARARVNTGFKVTGIGVAVLFGLLGVRWYLSHQLWRPRMLRKLCG